MAKEPIQVEEELSPEEWISAAEAGRIAGITRQAIQAKGLAGLLRSQLRGGQMYYLRSDVSELRPDDTLALQASLKQANAHAESLIKLVTEPASKMLSLLIAENESQRRRIGELEAQHLKMLESHEAALSQVHERALALKSSDRADERIDRVMQQALDAVPKLVSQAIGRRSVQKLVDTLTDEQLEVLKAAEVVSPEQFDLLRSIRTGETKPAELPPPKPGNGKAEA